MAIFTPNLARSTLTHMRRTNCQIMSFDYFDEDGNDRSELVDRVYCMYIIGQSNLHNEWEAELYMDWLYTASQIESDLPIEQRGCTCEICVRTIPEAAVLLMQQMDIDVKIF